MKTVSRKFLSALTAICVTLAIVPAASAEAAIPATVQDWAPVGVTGFAKGGFQSPHSLAVDSDGTLYIAFLNDESGRATVMKFDGTDWKPVGQPGFSKGCAYQLSLVLDSGGVPYVAYADDYNGKATVMKFDGTNWVPVGQSDFSKGFANYLSLVLDSGGVPYVAYADDYNSKATVMKFSGTDWVPVGQPDSSAGAISNISLALDHRGIPYVAFCEQESSDKVTVMKFDSTGWIPVGQSGLSKGESSDFSLVVDNGGTPYLAYEDTSEKAAVIKYTDSGLTGWESVGQPGFSEGTANGFSLLIDSSGTPYIAYADGGNSNKATVMKYTDSSATGWEPAGSVGFSDGGASSITLACSNGGTLFIDYSDMSHANTAVTVMKLTELPTYTITYQAGAHGSLSGGESETIASGAHPSAIPRIMPDTNYGFIGWSCDGGITLISDAQLRQTRFYSDTTYTAFFSNSNWICVGSEGFSAGATTRPSLAVDRDRTPYVAYISIEDESSYREAGKVTVKKFNGTDWETVGSAGFSPGSTFDVSLAIDGSGVPYIAYINTDSSANEEADNIVVMRYTNAGSTGWESVGNPNFTADSAPSLAVSSGGTPYVAYLNSKGEAAVMKYTGSSGWEPVGLADGFSARRTDFFSLAVDKNDSPYVAYTDDTKDGKATVMKYTSIGWEAVGQAGFSAGQAHVASLKLDQNDIPYVVYLDIENSGKLTVMKYTASTGWESVGQAGFSAGEVECPSLALDRNGNPYVAYMDGANSYKASVMKYTCSGPSGWAPVGSDGFSEGTAEYPFLAIDNGGTPYVVYTDDANSSKVTVMKYVTYTYAVTYNAGANGNLVGPGRETVASDTSPVNIPAVTANPGYVFAGWSSDGGKTLLTDAQLAATKIKSDITYTACYTQQTAAIRVTEVTLDRSSFSLTAGGASQALTASIIPANATDRNVSWSTNNASVATVKNGVVTPQSAGTASITVTTEDGGKTASCTVTVTEPGRESSHSSGTSASLLPSTVSDTATGIQAEVSGASFPAWVANLSLSVTQEGEGGNPVLPGATKEAADPNGAVTYNLAVSDAALNMIGTPLLYNIKLLDQNGAPITGFSGKVTVKIPIPAGLHGTPHVYRYDESSGTFTDLGATVQNGYLVFTTDHFSYYVVAGSGDSITLDTTSYQMPVGSKYQIGVKLTGTKAVSVKVTSTNDEIAAVEKLKNGNVQVIGKSVGTAYTMFDVYDNKNRLLTHASVRVDVKTGIRPYGDSAKQIGVF